MGIITVSNCHNKEKWTYRPMKTIGRKESNSSIFGQLINKAKRQPTESEKIFANNVSVKGVIPKTHKELKQLSSKHQLP